MTRNNNLIIRQDETNDSLIVHQLTYRVYLQTLCCDKYYKHVNVFCCCNIFPDPVILSTVAEVHIN